MKRKPPPAPRAPAPAEPPPDPIANHPDGCACPRCAGLERCHVCERMKLDIDWCLNCRRLVL
jgi:hypothetical protein